MRRIFSESYQVWFPGERVWELWFVDNHKGARLVDTCSDARLLAFKGRRKRILALPTGNQISLAFVSAAFGEKRLIKGARNVIKREGLECDIEGVGIQPVSGFPPRTLARIDVPVMEKRVAEFSDFLKPDLIVPAASLLPLPRNGIAIWTELRKPVLAVEKDGGTIHYQELSGSRDVENAREVRDLLARLQSEKLVSDKPALYLWNQSGVEIFQQVLSIEVSPGFRAAPSNLQISIGMRPLRYREGLHATTLRRKKIYRKCVAAFAIATAAILVTGSYAIAYFQTSQQKECIARMRPEANRIRTIKSQWEEMAPAVDRNASVLETWRKIFTLPSSPHIHISRMEIGKDAIELNCEASTAILALRFIDELVRVGNLSTFSWNYTTPELQDDGTALFVLKGFKS